ncbi:DEXQc_UvrD domain containing protein [Candidatus Nanopelagicaceae bacterium]
MSKSAEGFGLHLVANPFQVTQLSFDEKQGAAIAHRRSPLILRGATGTGKSATLVEAAIDRIRSGANPESILILAFGRERASEIRDAIVIASDGTVQEPVARTFHALAFSILSMQSGDTYRETVLISGAEQESFIKSLLQGNIDDQVDWWPSDLRHDQSAENSTTMGEPLLTQGFVRELRDLMMRANERGLTPEELAAKGKRLGEKFWPAAATFWEQYLEISANMDSGAGDSKMRIDPSEIINSAIAHLTNNPDLLTELRSRFTTIMVDEFHETDPAQRRLLQMLAGQDLFLVVDPQSAVGRFRGSDPDGVNQYLEANFPAATTITLDVNHWGAPTKFAVELRSEAEEAQYIAYQIKRAHLMEGIAYSEMAIILRAHNTTATAIRRALGQTGVPVAGDREAIASNAAIAPFLLMARIASRSEKPTIAECEQLLLSEFGGASSISLRRIRTSLLKARDEALDTRTGSQMIIDAIDKGDIPIEESAELNRVHKLLVSARASVRKKNATIHDLLWAIWSTAENSENQLILEAWQRSALRGGSRGAAADRDLDAMVQLFDSAARHIDRMPGSNPRIFLDEISQENIVSDLITTQGVRPDVVELLTVHSAKGLQFKRVFVAGIQEGIWPNLKQRSTLLGAERLVERERHGEELPQTTLDLITAHSLAEDERRLFHVATTRATDQLHITAVTREDDSPSAFFLEASESEDFTSMTFDNARPLTANALVASLRRALSTSKAPAAASILATLSSSHIAVADTDNWLGSHPLSTDAPLFSDGDLVPISPSAAESFEQCGLKWLLERNGGSNGDSTAQLLGSVIHEYARLKVEGADITDQFLFDSLDTAWPLISDSSGWISKTQLRRAQLMLQRFAEYHRKNNREVAGVELTFEFELGKAKVRGSVDRLEVDSDGRFFVVDFKTGKAISKKDAAENLQLACYQLAVVLNKLEETLTSPTPSPEVSGSHLVFLGHDAKDVTTRERPPIVAAEITEKIETIATQMSAPVFVAKKNAFCGTCPVKTSCPVHLEGRSVIG